MRAPRRPIPRRSYAERLTLVDTASSNIFTTIVVDDGQREVGVDKYEETLFIQFTGEKTIGLTMEQAKRLRGRINKFIADNK